MQPTIEVNNFVYLREVKKSSVCSWRSRLPQLWNHIPSDEAEPGYGFLTPHSHSHLPESTKAALVPSRLKMTRGKVWRHRKANWQTSSKIKSETKLNNSRHSVPIKILKVFFLSSDLKSNNSCLLLTLGAIAKKLWGLSSHVISLTGFSQLPTPCSRKSRTWDLPATTIASPGWSTMKQALESRFLRKTQAGAASMAPTNWPGPLDGIVCSTWSYYGFSTRANSHLKLYSTFILFTRDPNMHTWKLKTIWLIFS